MNEEEVEAAKKIVKLTLKEQHKEKTRENYANCIQAIHKWYLLNRIQVYTVHGILNGG